MRIDQFINQDKKMLFWEDGDNSIEVKKFMLKNELSCIVFSRYLGFRGDTITIHESFEFIEQIHIIDSNIKDISFIYNFANARVINIQNDDRTKLDFSNFKNLESLFLIWRKGTTNLFNQKSLKILKLHKFKDKITPDFDPDMQLEELWFSISPANNLNSLSKLKNLKILHLGYLRFLEDSCWIKDLLNLEILTIHSCKNISDNIIENVCELVNLKRLFFSKMGEIPTILPIQNLKKIESIGFIENTKIKDGNFEPLLQLPLLKNSFPSIKTIIRK